MYLLLFTLPGTPIIYYGDEIGMGDNYHLGDRDGVRTPMQWSPDRNAGYSRANPQRLYLPVIIDPEYHYETVNVEAQQANPHSLLWWMKRLIALRQRHPVLGRGTMEFLNPRNRKVLAFIRRLGDEAVLVVANLSRFVQYVELDLASAKGMIAVELFGGTPFPRIGELPYLLTLGPHAFYWFALTQEPSQEAVAATSAPAINVAGDWRDALEDPVWDRVAEALPRYLAGRRWFAGKARDVKGVTLVDTVPFPVDGGAACLALVQVSYREGAAETYQLVLGFASGERAEQVKGHAPGAVIAELAVRDRRREMRGILYDVIEDRGTALALLDLIARQRKLKGGHGEVGGRRARAFRPKEIEPGSVEPRPLSAEQSNSSVVYGEQLVLKLFRKLDEGVNPDLEIGLMLTERARFPYAPPTVGFLEYRTGRRHCCTLAALQGFVPSEGDAWEYTTGEVGRYFDGAVIRHREEVVPVPPAGVLALVGEAPTPLAGEMIGAYLETARLLGQRTAELHLALAGVEDDPAFTPEPFSTLYQRSLYQSMRNLSNRVFRLLEERLATLPKDARAEAEAVRALEPKVARIFRAITDRRITALRQRYHGDYHLGQVLHTGRDVVIIDFEGEPARPISERRIKGSPLRDVAGMLRSFDYAAHYVLATRAAAAVARPEELAAAETWAQFWRRWVSGAFLTTYLETAGKARFLPKAREELELLLTVFLLEKAIYELGYELNNRPDWVRVPVRGIAQLVQAAS